LIVHGVVSEIIDDEAFEVRYDFKGFPMVVEFYNTVLTENLEYLQVGIPVEIDTVKGTVKLMVEFWTQEEIDRAKEEAEKLSRLLDFEVY
jgi:hypothetical protein